MNAITKERLDKEFSVTGKALAKAGERIAKGRSEEAEKLLDMAARYYSDASHFREKGDWASAFGALNYAHGWLDAGAVLGIFDVAGESRLFVVD